MRLTIAAMLMLGAAIPVGCGDGTDSAAVSTTTEASRAPTTNSALTESPTNGATHLIGSWHRAQTCEEMLAAFVAAGLAESHVESITGNFFGGEAAPTGGAVCKGARGPLEHSHFFTAGGAFGSHDETGKQVDQGDFAVVDHDTVAFPSHASEFGYVGDLVVDYTVNGDVVTFEVAMPDHCAGTCADAYAWALSAFASGPWTRGEVP